MFQSAEETLPPCRMHLIGDVCLPGALLLDSMLFLRDLLVHSGVTPGGTEITHGVEATPRGFAEQVTQLSPQPRGDQDDDGCNSAASERALSSSKLPMIVPSPLAMTVWTFAADTTTPLTTIAIRFAGPGTSSRRLVSAAKASAPFVVSS